ncbi:hypothetical protein COB64_02945 [Candidatus Wolfebacteria bacterium]|nr:MAG: hypothetical protein COB64_02945 [Candidatus Wolfebacteria bacterium]
MSFEQPIEKGPEEQLYEKARDKAESFLNDIDPALKVRVSSVVVKTDYDGSKFRTMALMFTHSNNPSIKWTMEVSADEYFDERFEKRVRKLYTGIKSELN